MMELEIGFFLKKGAGILGGAMGGVFRGFCKRGWGTNVRKKERCS